ncbi:MAG: hypothetical protein IPG07_16965 [Crocinitomicaceae bacterium]|nr:hypothetical protein [Crocinitomicaceae bacterium]
MYLKKTNSPKRICATYCKKYQTNHHEIELSVNDFRDLIPEALSFMDHPSGDGPILHIVSKKTHEAGIKMALSGLGGDELLRAILFLISCQNCNKKMAQKFSCLCKKTLCKNLRKIKRNCSIDKNCCFDVA